MCEAEGVALVEGAVALVFLDLLDAVADVVVVSLLVQVGAHSQLDVLQGIHQEVPGHRYQPFRYILRQPILAILEAIDKLIHTIEHGVPDQGDLQPPEDRSDSEV